MEYIIYTTKRTILHVFLPVLVGSLIYILFRKESLNVFLWLDKISLLDTVVILRNDLIQFKDKIPTIILYSLPNGIWAYSATYLMLIIWGKYWEQVPSLFWMLTPLFLSVSAELLQLTNIVNGTFCFYDMVFYIAGFILPIIIFRRYYANQKSNN